MKNLKKLITAAVISAMVLTPAAVYADGIRVMLNGAELSQDISPVLDDGVLLVQAKPVLERLGFSVGWDDDEKKLTACTSADMIEVSIKNKTVFVNGEEYKFDAYPALIMNRVFFPEEFLQKILGLTTIWDPYSMTEVINTFDYGEYKEEEPVNNTEADFNAMYDRFLNIVSEEDKSKAFDIMMGLDLLKIREMAQDTEAIRAYVEETLSAEMYREALALYEKYKDAI